ncbi:hypothetical protein B0H11DRAFT_2421098, partial [Mycena galericulata]
PARTSANNRVSVIIDSLRLTPRPTYKPCSPIFCSSFARPLSSPHRHPGCPTAAACSALSVNGSPAPAHPCGRLATPRGTPSGYSSASTPSSSPPSSPSSSSAQPSPASSSPEPSSTTTNTTSARTAAGHITGVLTTTAAGGWVWRPSRS